MMNTNVYVSRKTVYATDPSYPLQQFVDDLRERIVSAAFVDPTAAHFWKTVRGTALEGLKKLEAAVSALDVQTSEKRELLGDALFLSHETLSWAKESESELDYADALAESAQTLLERLRYSELYFTVPVPQDSPHRSITVQDSAHRSGGVLLSGYLSVSHRWAREGSVSPWHWERKDIGWIDSRPPRPPVTQVTTTPASSWGLLFEREAA